VIRFTYSAAPNFRRILHSKGISNYKCFTWNICIQ